MSNFIKAFEHTMKNEGGFSDHPMDKGGPTNYGITLKTLSMWLGQSASVKTLKNLHLDTVKQIYAQYYWNPLSLGFIESDAKATAMFDAAVNFGVTRAAIMVQKAANVEVDGHIGRISIKAINDMSDGEFLERFSKEMETKYTNIVERNPTQKVFLKGWLARAKRILSLRGKDATTTLDG